MINPFKLLYGSQSVSFESELSVEEAKSNILKILKPETHISLIGKQTKGHMKGLEVLLYREHVSLFAALLWFPLFWVNINCPVFKGEFVNESGRTVLKGKFTLNLSTKISYTLFYLFCFFGFIVLNIAAIEIYYNENVPFVNIFRNWLLFVFILLLVVFFINRSIRKATMPDIQEYSHISKFITDCLEIKKT